MEGAVVVTFTENCTAGFPPGVIEACEGVQVDSVGAPAQLSATVPLNPLIDVTWRLYVAVFPGVTVAEADAPGARAIEKPVPVPVSPTD